MSRPDKHGRMYRRLRKQRRLDERRRVGAHDRWTLLGQYAVRNGEQFEWLQFAFFRRGEPEAARIARLYMESFKFRRDCMLLPPPTRRDRLALGLDRLRGRT